MPTESEKKLEAMLADLLVTSSLCIALSQWHGAADHGARKAALLLGHRHPSELPLELLADVELAPTLDLDDGEAVGELYWEEIRQHLGPSLQREGLEFSELGSRRMAMKLIAGFTTQPEFDTGQEVLELVWQPREGEYLRQPLLGIVLIGRGFTQSQLERSLRFFASKSN